MTGPASIAVLDIGKSNVKLSACTADGKVAETLSTENPVLPGPPWRHHDLTALNLWVLEALSALSKRHAFGHLIASGHGSGGLLVGHDPDAAGDGLALPMIDYEQPLPAGLAEAYTPLAGGFLDRGSAIMMAATHTARQMFWAETAQPTGFAKARWLLGVPQYWAWRLSGVAVSEVTILGAQSHLWNVMRRDWSPIVARRGWSRLMPGLALAHADLGPLLPQIARHHGLSPHMRIHAGVHDSSANFYRYQATGLADFCVVSTGTWIVAMADGIDPSGLDERRGMTLNADVTGAPLAGALTMGGREFSAVAGTQEPGAKASVQTFARLIAQGSMALPSFGGNDGQFPGTVGQGRILGLPPKDADERLALALIYAALLTVTCADAVAPGRKLIVDGSFLRNPGFASLVAALRPGAQTLVNEESYGIAAGAALLCARGLPLAPLQLNPPLPLSGLPDLIPYAARWRALAQGPNP
jgi:sugar (pentulose or hexulose) kinase